MNWVLQGKKSGEGTHFTLYNLVFLRDGMDNEMKGEAKYQGAGEKKKCKLLFHGILM